MAVTDALATAAEYRAEIDKVDTSEDAEVLVDLKMTTDYITRRLGGRFFTKDAAAVARVYKPRSSIVLPVDDIVTLTSVKVDSAVDGTYETTLVVGTDFELTPRNAALGSEPAPYEALERITGSWVSTSRVQVTAVFGWPSVPGPVKSCCIQLTAIYRLETPRAQSQITDLGQVVGINANARNLIEDLILHYGRVTL